MSDSANLRMYRTDQPPQRRSSLMVPGLLLMAGIVLLRSARARRWVPLLSALSALACIEPPSRRRREARIDEAVAESFPASDPPALR